MKIVSVNVGMPKDAIWKGMPVTTGIFKEPVAGSVSIKKINLIGDGQADLAVHGGPEKAVYGYPSEHYRYWREELSEVSLSWGNFGENLTTEGLDEYALCIGDHVRAGSAVLMVTQPRMPCYKLELRFHRDDMIKRFLKSGRTGFYFSVVEEGEVEAGSEIEVVHQDSNRVTVADILNLYLRQTGDGSLLQRAVDLAALPQSWKTQFLLQSQ